MKTRDMMRNVNIVNIPQIFFFFPLLEKYFVSKYLQYRSIRSRMKISFHKILEYKYVFDDKDIKILLNLYKSFIILGVADLGTGNAVATGPREHNYRCIHQDRVQLAIERDRFHRSGGLLFSSAEEQVERLQGAGKGGWPVRIRWEGLPIEGHLRSCLRSFRWYSRFVGTAVARLLQVIVKKRKYSQKRDPSHLSGYFDNNLNPVQKEKRRKRRSKKIDDP